MQSSVPSASFAVAFLSLVQGQGTQSRSVLRPTKDGLQGLELGQCLLWVPTLPRQGGPRSLGLPVEHTWHNKEGVVLKVGERPLGPDVCGCGGGGEELLRQAHEVGCQGLAEWVLCGRA